MAEGTITVTHLRERERYRADLVVDGFPEEVGYLDYTRDSGHADGDHLALTHTVVFAQYGGRGYAGQLVKSVLDDIRERGDKVIPVCSYVIHYLERHPEYNDLVVSNTLT
ncbi:MAG: GNAT family N-acetyltransferase [Gordonia sp. (in: high G+C Gram-positive bacteria)]